MSFQVIKQVMSPEELKDRFPLSLELTAKKKQRDEEIRKVFTGESDKFLVIIGPCSADHEDAVCDYVSRLAAIQEHVKDTLLLIPRVYTNKPRTTGEGYKGIVHQPDPEKKPDLSEGLIAMRYVCRRRNALPGKSALCRRCSFLYRSRRPLGRGSAASAYHQRN